MTSQTDHIDQFESIFRAAEREPFGYASVPIETVAVVTDGDAANADQIAKSVAEFAPALQNVSNWRSITGDAFSDVAGLLEVIDAEQTDLIVTYRHLKEESLVPRHSLGVFLDVMTQATRIPVLVLPGTAANPMPLSGRNCNRVMIVTDQISGDNRLINYGVRMCADGGTVWLCHVEDDVIFHRYMQAIAKIPEIDTEAARTLLESQLLKEASDFIDTCLAVLREKRPELAFESQVTRGHHLRQYRELIDSQNIDLLVANTKDEEQLAMHGMTYSLSVELVDVPLLLL